jgi:hypothetical protein
MRALIAGLEALAITRASLPATRRAISDMHRVVDAERRRIEETEAKVGCHYESRQRTRCGRRSSRKTIK